MMLGKEGKIWFSNYSGGASLVVYDPKEDCFTNYYPDKKDSTQLYFNWVRVLQEDNFGKICGVRGLNPASESHGSRFSFTLPVD